MNKRVGGITALVGAVAAVVYAHNILPPFTRVAQDDTVDPLSEQIDAYAIDPGFADEPACEAFAATIPGTTDAQNAANITYCGTLSYTPPCDYSSYVSGATTESQCDSICDTIDENAGCTSADCIAFCSGIEW